MSDEKLTIPEFKYLQNQKWYEEAVKSTRTRKSLALQFSCIMVRLPQGRFLFSVAND